MVLTSKSMSLGLMDIETCAVLEDLLTELALKFLLLFVNKRKMFFVHFAEVTLEQLAANRTHGSRWALVPLGMRPICVERHLAERNLVVNELNLRQSSPRLL